MLVITPNLKQTTADSEGYFQFFFNIFLDASFVRSHINFLADETFQQKVLN